MDNDYLLKDIGKFPNVSALEYANGKLFISSRTKSRIAVIDYETLKPLTEFTTVNKPISMLLNKDILYVLGAQSNEIQKINTTNNSIAGTITLGTNGFSSGLKRVDNTNMAVVCDLKNNYYTLIDLESGTLLKTYAVNIPIKDVIIADKVQLFE